VTDANCLPHRWTVSTGGVYDLQEGDGSVIDCRGAFCADVATHLRIVPVLGREISSQELRGLGILRPSARTSSKR
jgi:hypothetical protein